MSLPGKPKAQTHREHISRPPVALYETLNVRTTIFFLATWASTKAACGLKIGTTTLRRVQMLPRASLIRSLQVLAWASSPHPKSC